MTTALDTACTTWSLTNPRIIDTTGIATVWHVTRHHGPAALKIYHNNDIKNEGPGFDLLRDLDGRGTAQIYAQQDASILMEWLGGPSLGDLSRTGQDAQSAQHLVGTANQIHHTAAPNRAYPTLHDWYAALFSLKYAPTCPPALRADFAHASDLAQHLLATQTDIRPLHGDLHQDNVKQGPRGWCAFDAKGVLGERTYELANAMRNPKGTDALMRDPARIRHIRDLWCAQFHLDPTRFIQWTVAKSALSIAWACGGTLDTCDGSDLPGVFAAHL